MKSTTTVYGASPRDPAMFTEDMGPKRLPSSGYAKDVYEIEGYVRGFARRRPDVDVTMLRAANVIGPHVVSPLTSYFRLPVIPRVLGFDPRLQFLHEDDLLGVLRHAATTGIPGTFNVAGDGMLTLTQAVRRLGTPSVPMPGFAVGRLGSTMRQARIADFSPEQLAFLTYGRGVDTTRMRTELGFEPTLHHRRGVRRLLPRARAHHAGREPAVPEEAPRDAEIIPIGTGGRPGRGTGKRPAVLGRPQPRARRRKKAAPRSGRPAARPAAHDSRPADRSTESARRTCVATSAPTATGRPGHRDRGRAPTEDRQPRPAGIPVGDWLAAAPGRRHGGLRRRLGAPRSPSSWRSCAAG